MSEAVPASSLKDEFVFWLAALAAIIGAGFLIAGLYISINKERERGETASAYRPPVPLRDAKRRAASPPNSETAKSKTAKTEPPEPGGKKDAPLKTAAPANLPPIPLRNEKRHAASSSETKTASEDAKAVPLQTGQASWYDFHGQTTANGEEMHRSALTAAHKSLPLGSMVVVENVDNGREVEVRINDRGPFAGGRIIDLSKEAAEKLDMLGDGVAKVVVKPADE